MTERAPSDIKNLDRYGNEPLPWSRARAALATGGATLQGSFFLGTVGPDGRPHSAAVGAAWHDGDLYFTSSPAARKARNLATNPACTVSASLEGIDLVFDGEATRVTDRATLDVVSALYRADGWPAEVKNDAFTAPYSAPSAGPPPWYLYRCTFHAVYGVATAEPNGATRWRFAS